MQTKIEKRLEVIDNRLGIIEDEIWHAQVKLNALITEREELEEEYDELMLIKLSGDLEDV